MLVNIFELPRDRSQAPVDFSSIGILDMDILHQVASGYDHGPLLWDVSPKAILGGSIVTDRRQSRRPFIKTMEVYTSRKGIPTVIERIGYDQGSKIHLFKTRYRTPETTMSLVTPSRIVAVHADIGGREMSRVVGDARWSPVVEAMQYCNRPEIVANFERVAELMAAELPMVEDLFAIDTAVQEDVEISVVDFFSDLVNPVLAMNTRDDVIEMICEHLRTDIPQLDPMTGLCSTGPVSRHTLTSLPIRPMQIDRSVCGPLENPGTSYDPEHGLLAKAFDKVPLTEFCVTYTVTPTRDLIRQDNAQLVDRYQPVMVSTPDVTLIEKTIAHLAMVARSLCWKHIGHRPFQMVLTKTHNEEACVRAFRDGVCLETIYLDLARLSLCSLGVTTSDALIPFE